MRGLFCHTLSNARPPPGNSLSFPPSQTKGTPSGLAPMDSEAPGDVRTGALESRPLASSLVVAAPPPPPPPPQAYLGGLGCPRVSGTWKRQREHSSGLASVLLGLLASLRRAGPRRVLTSMWVSMRARHRARDGGKAVQWLHCCGAEPGSRKPPFPEEM